MYKQQYFEIGFHFFSRNQILMAKSSKASRYSDTNMKYKRQNVIIRSMLMYLNTPEKK